MSTFRQNERILSIQSHVVFGYVGGKAAVFPLQCLGYNVDVVNTVNFSNHSGYRRSGGSRATVQEMNDMIRALELNELLMPTKILTGYIPGAEGLQAVKDIVTRLKESNPHVTYLLDPVMGDFGRLYVSPEVIPVYRDMLSLATIITPNWFEAELLTEVELKDMASLYRALEVLHYRYNVPHVVISSIPLKPWLSSVLPSSIRPQADASYLICISSAREDPQSPFNTNKTVIHAQCVPLIPGYFAGVGDLFSALLLGHFHPNEKPKKMGATPLSEAVSHALTKTHAILQITHEESLNLPEEERQLTDDELDEKEPLRRTRRMRGRELALIKGQDLIRGVGIESLREMKIWEGFWNTQQGS